MRWIVWIKTLGLGSALLLVSLAVMAASTYHVSPQPDLTAPDGVVFQTGAANSCTDCHLDKDKLIKNAKIVEEKPKESEGTG